MNNAYSLEVDYPAAVAEESLSHDDVLDASDLEIAVAASLFPNSRICDVDSGASADATTSERDDSRMVHEGAARVAARSPTAGPAATSSQGDFSGADDLEIAPITDYTLREDRIDYSERDRLMSECGMRRSDFF